jgi:hypothetical protein
MDKLLTVTKSAIALAWLASIYSVSLLGQAGLSTIRGTATDVTGAIVPGVNVTAREVLTNVIARTVATDAQGNYEIPALKSGTYQVSATQGGFKRSIVDDVQLQSSQVRRVDFTLEVGEVATEVTVIGAVRLARRATPARGLGEPYIRGSRRRPGPHGSRWSERRNPEQPNSKYGSGRGA